MIDNTVAPQNTILNIVAVKHNVGPNGEDGLQQTSRAVFTAKSPEVLTYDDDGNLTADGHWMYAWDAENRLVAVQTQPGAAAASAPNLLLTFAYDSSGRRIQKKVAAWTGSTYAATTDTRFVYDGWNLAEECLGTATVPAATYVWGLDLSGTIQGAGGVGGLVGIAKGTLSYVPAYDASGNLVTLISSDNGTIVGNSEYDTFGAVLRSPNLVPFGFSTKYLDSETSFQYYGFRYYQPGTGRWLGRDPIEERGGINLYGMVGNDPGNWFDPLRLSKCSDLAEEVLKQAGKLAAEWAKYDPVGDAIGNFLYTKRTVNIGGIDVPVDRTKPNGHNDKLLQLKRGLWNRLNDYKRDCWDDDDDCPKPPKIPAWVWDVAKKPIPVPITPLNPFQEWARNTTVSDSTLDSFQEGALWTAGIAGTVATAGLAAPYVAGALGGGALVTAGAH